MKLFMSLFLFVPFIQAMDFGVESSQKKTQSQDKRHYEHFTYFQKGDLPIILTAPHGGRKDIGVPRRKKGVQVWDDGTLELALALSDRIYALTGARPYLVAADFTREQIDANRPAHKAYEHRNAKPVYDFYHGKIAEYISDIRKRFGTYTILLDIHGQGTDANTIFRGTHNRFTVSELIKTYGEEALTGPLSILGILTDCGHRVFPRINDNRMKEDSHYDGGWTVYHYHEAYDINALQLELGWNLRRAHRDSFVNNLAQALVYFYAAYLLP